MHTYEFRLPDIGEGIAEAEIVAWHAKVGDFLEEDQPLADVMTDKATVEITAPVSGRVVAVAGETGQMVSIGAVLATFEIEDEEATISDVPSASEIVVARPETASDLLETAPSQALPSERAPEPTTGEVAAIRGVPASPSVRKRARDLGIDLADIKYDGPRLRHGDLDSFLTYNRSFGPAAATRSDEAIKVMGMRRRIAENMAASKRNIPHFSYIEELDVTRLEEMRAEMNAARKDRPRLTILPFLITAVCKVLPDFPMMNARYDDEAGIVTRFGAVHLGVATQTPQGLMVPVVRNAEALNIWQLGSEIGRLAEAARSGKARSDELSGSTITVTSLGALGGIATTPVINRPEVAILGPNKIIERPAFRGREVVPAKLMNLSISCDHRVVDGWEAASFVQAVKTIVEKPSLIFMP